MHILLAISGIVFLITISLVAQGKTIRHDEHFSNNLFGRRNEIITKIMLFFTNLGKGGPVAAIILLLFLIPGTGSTLPRVTGISACVTFFLCQCLKRTVKRKRPEGNRLVEETDFSFPSAHALGAAAIYGSIALNASVFSSPLSFLIIIISVLFIFCIGFSRIYLGIHYLTDVLGGWSCGLLVAGVVTMLMA